MSLEKVSNVGVFNHVLGVNDSCIGSYDRIFDKSCLEVIWAWFGHIYLLIFWFTGQTQFFLKLFVIGLKFCFVTILSFIFLGCLTFRFFEFC